MLNNLVDFDEDYKIFNILIAEDTWSNSEALTKILNRISIVDVTINIECVIDGDLAVDKFK